MPRPTSTHEQRESVRLLALSVGVREAARQLNLNEDRVCAWAARYNWLPQQPNLPITMQSDTASIASKAADSFANTLVEQGKTTKYHLSKAAMKAADRFQEMPGDTIIDKADRLVAVTKVASTIHGWDNSATTSALNLNVLSGGRAIVQVNETRPNES